MTLAERLTAFFAVFPAGAGADWLAGFLGSTRTDVDAACTALGCVKVERYQTPVRPPLLLPPPIGHEWRAAR